MPVESRRPSSGRPAVAGFYSAPLAAVHVAAFASHVRAASPFVCRLLRAHGIRSGRVLDLACGGGQLSAALARSGWEPWGLDVSPAMVAIARASVPDARFLVGDLARARLPRCRAALCVGEGLSYLPGPAAVRRVLARLAKVIEPNGLLVFDAVVSTRPGSLRRRTIERVTRDWALLADIIEDERRGVVVRRMTTLVRHGRSFRRAHDVHRQRLYRISEILAWLRAAGFHARALRGYGSVPLGPMRRVFVARRRAAR